MIKVGIVGASGYAGMVLTQILLEHPEVEIVWLMATENSGGKSVADLYPHLTGVADFIYLTMDEYDNVYQKVDLIFLALPHGAAMDFVPKAIAAGKKVIDLGADYRFNDNEVFKKWYGLSHADEKYIKQAIFGLPELYREKIKGANLVGNPGCYPTASILAIAPLIKNNLIDPDSIIVDAKSGISGAGRAATHKTHFCERNDGIEAYSVVNHRHMGEIEYQVSRIAGNPIHVTFVPHLVPMDRGILVTIYAKGKQMADGKQLTALFKEFYKGEKFIRIFEDKLPNTKYVAGTNYCDIAVQVNEATGQIIVLSAIDNLVKGAAGQAVQNMNIMFALPEETALKKAAIYP